MGGVYIPTYWFWTWASEIWWKCLCVSSEQKLLETLPVSTTLENLPSAMGVSCAGRRLLLWPGSQNKSEGADSSPLVDGNRVTAVPQTTRVKTGAS